MMSLVQHVIEKERKNDQTESITDEFQAAQCVKENKDTSNLVSS